MAAIRSAIQKEVFNPVDERLVGIVNVTKLGRKKKASFLCLSGKCSRDNSLPDSTIPSTSFPSKCAGNPATSIHLSSKELGEKGQRQVR